MRKSRRDRVRNEDVRENLGVDSLRGEIKRRKLKFSGALKGQENIQKKPRRKRIGKKPRWKDRVKKDLKKRGADWQLMLREESCRV